MLFRRPVSLQGALQRIIEPNMIFTIDDAMRQFASEPGAPPGDYRIVERGKRNRQREYVVQRIQQEAGFATGYTATGKKRGPRQAQRIVAEGVKEPRSVTAPRWKLIQAGAQKSFHRYQVEDKLRALSDHGTIVNMTAVFIIENDPRDYSRTIRSVFIPSRHDNRAIGDIWEQFIDEWRAENYEEATEKWNEAYFKSFCGYVGFIYDVTWLVMETIASAQEIQEAA